MPGRHAAPEILRHFLRGYRELKKILKSITNAVLTNALRELATYELIQSIRYS